jgi:hypothetical protein
MTKRAALFMLLGFLVGCAGFALSSPNSFDVSLDPTTAALSQSNIPVTSGQVRRITSVRATQANPDLEVTSIIPWQKASARVRMRCRQPEVCLPFYVIIAWATPAEMVNVVQSVHPATKEITGRDRTSHESWLVHSGDRATLVMMSQHMRIELPVVCLSNGSAGHSIRVASTDHKQTYVAEVVGEKLLKGGL